MRRFIFIAVMMGPLMANMVQSKPFSAHEKQWIDAHPIVRFSIHEKYAPYLDHGGVFHSLLKKIEECTRQQFTPVWRSSDKEGLRQLSQGEVDFMIDPPFTNHQVLQFGSLSESIFWGYDAVLAKSSTNFSKPNLQLAFFHRGFQSSPHNPSDSSSHSSNTADLLKLLLKNEVEALVLPIRLAGHLMQHSANQDLKIDGLYSRKPFAYQWLIGHHHIPLHDVLSHFLNNLDPLDSRHLFSLHDKTIKTHQLSVYRQILPWLGLTFVLLLGGALFYQLQRKYSSQKQATIKLAKSKEIAEKANAAKSAFLATLSHEIRTPMNAILGVQELLLGSEQFPSKDKPLLKSAQASAESLLGMLNQVLDLSKIEAGKLTLNLEPCNLHQLITDIHSSFSIVAEKQGLKIITSIDPRIAQALMVDSLRLRQVLQNLLSNAIKFTNKGEIYFSITVLADDHAGQLVEFRVIDTGVGMASAQIELALQAFEQVPSAPDPHGGENSRGTGLGLTITNHLVSSMNSHLYFESALGFGSNVHFCVALPRTSIAAANISRFNASTHQTKQFVTKHGAAISPIIQALVVEDHPASRQILSLQLEALGVKTEVCESASEALQMLTHKRFDLMLTDQSMPGMQGSDLAKQIRMLGNRDLIIIGVTADIYALDSRHQFLSAGMNGILIKPLSIGALENELLRYFKAVHCDEPTLEEYSFAAFSNLIDGDPKTIRLILDEIQRVHDEALQVLRLNPISLDEVRFQSLVHRVKGGAQLLDATHFITSCRALEVAGPLPIRIEQFITLLQHQEEIIKRYQSKYQ